MSTSVSGSVEAPATTGPLQVFRVVAVGEAMSWAGLLVGMFLKRVTHTTDLGVTVFGPIHGVVFLAFCLVTVVVAVDQGWSRRRMLLGLASSLPPFFTVLFDRYAESRGLLGTAWLSRHDSAKASQRAVCVLLRHPVRAVVLLLVVVAALASVALVVGPPGS